MNNDTKPSFICIGPGRTGTTWLFNYLQNHKDVYVVPGKEINFFNNFYEKGFDWYASFFKSNVSCKGEISNTYFLLTSTIDKIEKDLSNIKLIFCLRDPKSLAKSIYDFAIRRGIYFKNFDEFLEYPYIKIMGSSGNDTNQDELKVTVRQSLDYKKYIDYLDNKELDIFFFNYSNLKNNHNELINKICLFLEIEPVRSENSKEIINKSGTPRFKFIMPFLSPIIFILKKIGLRKLVSFLKTNTILNNLLFKKEKRSSLISEEDLSCLDNLEEEYYKIIKAL